jgi:hypothetical protein
LYDQGDSKPTLPAREAIMAKRRRRNGSSVRAWFKEQFQAHPEWLDVRENDTILNLWMTENNKTEVPDAIRANLASLKSKMRSELRGNKPGPRKTNRVAASSVAGEIDRLEVMIDNCISFARNLQVDKLDEVIKHLRRGRAQIMVAFDH